MKSTLRNSLYVFSLSPAVLAIYGNLNGGILTFTNVFYSLVILATIEWIVPSVTSNNHSDKNDAMPHFIALMHVPFQLASLLSLFYGINEGIIEGYWIVGAALSTGLNSGSSAIVVAHELIHRKNNFEQSMGKLLLFTAGNMYFYVAHLRVHHKWVGTDKDFSTARYGESLYGFFIRSAKEQFIGSMQMEATRLSKENKAGYGLGNYVVRQVALQICLLLLLFAILGPMAVYAYLIQCVFANFLLEYINYSQHYGLTRAENQRVTEHHSWDCDKVVSRFVLVDLARHADHHYYASKPFHTLENYENSPKLPTGYAGLFFIAAIPPLWKKVMHKRLVNFHSS